MNNRRSVLAGIIGVTAIARAQAAPSPMEQVENGAAAVASAMKLLHGGDWLVRIDHARQVVLVISRGREARAAG